METVEAGMQGRLTEREKVWRVAWVLGSERLSVAGWEKSLIGHQTSIIMQLNL